MVTAENSRLMGECIRSRFGAASTQDLGTNGTLHTWYVRPPHSAAILIQINEEAWCAQPADVRRWLAAIAVHARTDAAVPPDSYLVTALGVFVRGAWHLVNPFLTESSPTAVTPA